MDQICFRFNDLNRIFSDQNMHKLDRMDTPFSLYTMLLLTVKADFIFCKKF